MQVKSIAECFRGSIPLEHFAIDSTFIKLPFAIKTFVLFIFERPLKTGFTVHRVTLSLSVKVFGKVKDVSPLVGG